MSKQYCNLCECITEHDKDNECPYHQKVLTDSDGVRYLKYDEFNQDGDEW